MNCDIIMNEIIKLSILMYLLAAGHISRSEPSRTSSAALPVARRVGLGPHLSLSTLWWVPSMLYVLLQNDFDSSGIYVFFVNVLQCF